MTQNLPIGRPQVNGMIDMTRTAVSSLVADNILQDTFLGLKCFDLKDVYFVKERVYHRRVYRYSTGSKVKSVSKSYL